MSERQRARGCWGQLPRGGEAGACGAALPLPLPLPLPWIAWQGQGQGRQVQEQQLQRGFGGCQGMGGPMGPACGPRWGVCQRVFLGAIPGAIPGIRVTQSGSPTVDSRAGNKQKRACISGSGTALQASNRAARPSCLSCLIE